MISPTPFLEFLRDFKGSMCVCVRLGTWHELLQLSDFGDVMGVFVEGRGCREWFGRVGRVQATQVDDGWDRAV